MRMLSKMILVTLITCSTLLLSGCDSTAKDKKKIGALVPISHQAMDEMVSGFIDTFKHQSVKIKVMNAQGDMNLQQAIIQQMKANHYDVIVTIGTAATQMAVANIHDQAVVGLATHFNQADRKKCKSHNVAIVHDEISVKQQLKFIHQLYPALTELVLIHSGSEKVYQEVADAIASGKTLGITIKPLMINNLNEMHSAINSITHTQAIFILKDNIVVSGVSILAQYADKHHIPLICSDQGSVQNGATIALGVHERDIGVECAKLADAILRGKKPDELPITEMKHLIIFLNKHVAIDMNIKMLIEKTKYDLEIV